MLEFVKEIAREAGVLLVNAFEQPAHYEQKVSYADLVTDTDKQVEALLKSRILKKHPDDKIIAEESASSRSVLSENNTWIIDPIDGTSNFVSKFPFCAVCIGYYVHKEPRLAVVYNPITNQMFHAEKGKGAYINNRKIHVSKCSDLHDALILTDWGGDRDPANLDTKGTNMRRLIAEARGVRTMGSAALHMCQVAAGQGDVFFEFGIHCWDYAAASLIVTEAGGYCCSADGGPVDLMSRHCIAASNKQLAEKVAKMITPIAYPRD